MELIERDGFLDTLRTEFKNIESGEGHCIFVSGEAGIGKTSLVKMFCKELKDKGNIYQGTCDALFSPRPLAPLYDILLQMGNGLPEIGNDITDRTAFFTRFHHRLKNEKEVSLLIFEDIHWADEATLDFIKFLGRRITQLRCLFILTYRENEIHAHHPLRTVLGQLHAGSFTRMQLLPLTKQAVEKLAVEKGYSGEDVFSITGGNPFYVNEILASYSPGIPENIKDSILSVYNRLDEKTKQLWQILSVLPTGLEIRYLEKMEPSFTAAIESCLDSKILISKNELIFFKHELYRRTIETSLSPLVRIALNKKIIDLFKESFEQRREIERIIHHAKNANEYELVAHYAPVAARQAALAGAHIEAAKLYLSAIEYYQGNDKDMLLQFYNAYAYECYLTNQIKEAIIYAGKSLHLIKEKKDTGRIADCMRFLSRLWWLDGNIKNAEDYAEQAIEVLDDQPSSHVKAMAFSNKSQIKMMLDQPAESIKWGEKAIDIAKELGDEESLSHALNNVGSVYMNFSASEQKGIEMLQQSLEIALKNSFHEHAARAYSNLGSNALKMKNYLFSKKILEEGIEYCDERDLDSWRLNNLSLLACLHLETGDWNTAYSLADNLLKNEDKPRAFRIAALIVIASVQMRRGDGDPLPLLLTAETKALETTELQRIVPSLIALLEYEWITGKNFIKPEDLNRCKHSIEQSIYTIEKNEFAFWLHKTRKEYVRLNDVYKGYDVSSVKKAQQAAVLWEKTGNTYAQALTLFEGDDDDKRKAISIVQKMGAVAICEKMKFEMRASGIKSIPRGIRKSTKSNPANLTERELDVLQLLKEGLTNKEIASRLFISTKTVDHHISSIFFKLDVNSRIKAVQEAIRSEIIK
jgi:DNA-binding CsgD family transcriptional regulator/GTPase SAR1 family protein